jgi:hypothetical protein
MNQSYKKLFRYYPFSVLDVILLYSKPDDKQIQENVTKHLQVNKKLCRLPPQ